MKVRPAMLLGALIAGSLSVSAHAEDDSGHSGGCTGTVVSACGVRIVKTVCSSQTVTDDDKDEPYELHGSDDGHSDRTQSSDIDASDGVNTYRKDDSIPPSNYPGHERNYNFSYTDPHGVKHDVDWHQRMGTSPDGKVTICHRMGGARVTLDVPDDQINGVRAHGHGNHDLDTLGRCSDQEDSGGNDDPVKISAAKPLSENSSVSGSVTACLTAPAGTSMSVSLPGGSTWSGPAPGCNAAGVSCNVPTAVPSRAGVKTLR